MEIKTIDLYYDEVYKRFPDVPKEDIRRILCYGWRLLYLHNSYGGDVLISGNNLWCYFGMLKKDPLKHFYYYIKKLAVRLRILYRRRLVEWDGYYYFALSNNQYEEYLQQKNRRGRPKKWYTFRNVFLYLLLDECKIRENSCRYIFRVPYTSLINFRFFVPELVTDKAELVMTREPLKFKDIAVLYNNYDNLW